MSSSCCSSSRQSRAGTSSTGSPQSRSSNRLWSDINDDSEEELWGRDQMLPGSLLEKLNDAERLFRASSQKSGDSPDSDVPSYPLDPHAPEFLPTLTHQCPVVGICHVIMEGNEDSAPQQESCSRRSKPSFWAKSRPAPLQKVQTPIVSQDSRQELSEEQMLRRERSIEVGKETKEYHFLIEQRKLGRIGDEPLTPDPRDHSLSKRQWLRVVQSWREELKSRHLAETTGVAFISSPDAASVASTEAEEVHGSEADDTITVHSDDASSAQWSSR